MGSLKKIAQIIADRDEESLEDAMKRVKEVRELIYNDPDSAEDILMEELGLEMDYMFDII